MSKNRAKAKIIKEKKVFVEPCMEKQNYISDFGATSTGSILVVTSVVSGVVGGVLFGAWVSS